MGDHIVHRMVNDEKSVVLQTDSFFGDEKHDFGSGRIAPLAIVCCYNSFDDLAHQPRGTMAAKYSIMVYKLDLESGCMNCVSCVDTAVRNPAFIRVHPTLNVFWVCTESITDDGEIHAFSFDPYTGQCTSLGYQSAEGTSTCYLTLDSEFKNLLLVNYWDSTVGTMPVNSDGSLLPLTHMYKPPRKAEISSKREGGRAHSENDAETAKLRQEHPHTHSIVLDPIFGRVAFAPDLGMDIVRQFVYTPDYALVAAGICQAGLAEDSPLGPRYISFHKHEVNGESVATAYVVNELASSISVFLLDNTVCRRLIDTPLDQLVDNNESALKLVQTISTIPHAFPRNLNTCGRVAVHPSGRWVVVSNRGHDSIAIFKTHSSQKYMLTPSSLFHTRGETPRHFQFDKSGEYLIVANQDTDNVAVFRFNQSTGKASFTDHQYRCYSPNFVQVINPNERAANVDLKLLQAKI